MSGTENAKKFRESIKGYNKADVNKYIEESDRRFSQTENELKREIASLRDKLTAYETAEAANSDSAGQLAEAEKIILTLREELEAKNDEIGALKRENLGLKEKLDSDGEAAKKAELYDKLSSQVGDMLLHAGGAADAMLRNAESEAERINTEAAELKRATSEKLRQMLDEANSVFKNMSKEAMNSLNVYNDEAGRTLAALMESLRARSESMQKELEENNRAMFDKMLAELDSICVDKAKTADGDEKR